MLISFGGWIGPGNLGFSLMMGMDETMGLDVGFDESTDIFFIGGRLTGGTSSTTPQLMVKNYSFYLCALLIS